MWLVIALMYCFLHCTAGKTIKACFGTTKYCNAFLKGVPCNNTDCLYLHEIGESCKAASASHDVVLPFCCCNCSHLALGVAAFCSPVHCCLLLCCLLLCCLLLCELCCWQPQAKLVSHADGVALLMFAG
jgi:hypothetical protein